MEITFPLIEQSNGNLPAMLACMENHTITPDRIRRALAETIRSGPVHLFADEADTIARNCVIMLRERFPSVFRKRAKSGNELPTASAGKRGPHE